MRYQRLDLNLLTSLRALLAERSVTRAAEKVFLSQSAMSGVLARLREYFDDQLIIRKRSIKDSVVNQMTFISLFFSQMASARSRCNLRQL